MKFLGFKATGHIHPKLEVKVIQGYLGEIHHIYGQVVPDNSKKTKTLEEAEKSLENMGTKQHHDLPHHHAILSTDK